MNNKFKSTKLDTWRTRDLFVEILRKCYDQGTYEGVSLDDCLYWLSVKNDENDPRPVLRELFIETRDITGYTLATKYLGGWRHFEHLLKCRWFRNEWDKWQEELFMLIQSEALLKINELATLDGPTALSAAKFLSTKEWEKAPPKRGRPSKEEVTGEMKQQVKILAGLQKDYQKLTVIPGGRAG